MQTTATKKASDDLHPIDRIAMANHHITGIALVLGYAIEKDAEDGDGVGPQYLDAVISAIGHFCAEIDTGVRQICDESLARKADVAASGKPSAVAA